MNMNRRDVLRTGSMIGLGALAPRFLGNTAFAAPDAARSGAKDTILVVVQLTGGNDGLNTVVPFADPLYAKLRPKLGVATSDLRKLNDSVGLHPALEGFSKLADDGLLGVVQGVGYPNPSQSHFRSMDVWQAADTAETLNEGWLGKALRSMKSPAYHVAANNEISPLALAGAPVRVPSVRALDDFAPKSLTPNAMPSPTGTGGNNLMDFVRRTDAAARDSADRLAKVGKTYVPKVPYPETGLAGRLKLCAQLIDSGLGARIYYAAQDGYDTHANQGGVEGSHAKLLAELSGAVTAFYRDVSARGHGKRVLVVTFSEFGRRAHENGSKGTDHGAAAPLFLIGQGVKAGVLGAHPKLENLDEGNLKHAVDFRSVYADVLGKWLGVEAGPIVGGFTGAGCLA